MIKVTVINKQSERAGWTGDVQPSDWQSDSFWVPVKFGRHHGMVARINLVRA